MPLALIPGDDPGRHASNKSLSGGDHEASVLPEERGLDQEGTLTPFINGETETQKINERLAWSGGARGLNLHLGLPLLWVRHLYVVMATVLSWLGVPAGGGGNPVVVRLRSDLSQLRPQPPTVNLKG